METLTALTDVLLLKMIYACVLLSVHVACVPVYIVSLCVLIDLCVCVCVCVCLWGSKTCRANKLFSVIEAMKFIILALQCGCLWLSGSGATLALGQASLSPIFGRGVGSIPARDVGFSPFCNVKYLTCLQGPFQVLSFAKQDRKIEFVHLSGLTSISLLWYRLWTERG